MIQQYLAVNTIVNQPDAYSIAQVYPDVLFITYNPEKQVFGFWKNREFLFFHKLQLNEQFLEISFNILISRYSNNNSC